MLNQLKESLEKYVSLNNLVRDVHQVKEDGSTFRAKNAKGDIKKQGKPDPYAFIQLNPKALNKRFTRRSEKSF